MVACSKQTVITVLLLEMSETFGVLIQVCGLMYFPKYTGRQYTWK